MALQPQPKRPYVELPHGEDDPLAGLPKLGQLTPGQRSRLAWDEIPPAEAPAEPAGPTNLEAQTAYLQRIVNGELG